MARKSSGSIGAIMGIAGAVAAALGLLYRWPLGNIIGMEGLADYSAAFPLWSLLFVAATAGVPVAVSRLVAGRAAQGDYLGAQDILFGSGASMAVVGIAFTLPLLLFADQLANAIGIPGAAGVFKTAAPLFLIMLLYSAVAGYFKGMQLAAPAEISGIIANVFKLIAGLVLAGVLIKGGAEKGAFGGMLGVTIAEALAFIFIIVMYLLSYNNFQYEIQNSKNGRSLPYMAVIAKVWSMALPVICGFAVAPFAMLIDSVMTVPRLTALGYSGEVALQGFGMLEGIATPLACAVMPVLTLFMVGMTPQITAFRVRKNAAGLRNAASAAFKVALMISLPLAVGLFVLARPITSLLFGSVLNDIEIGVIAGLLRTLSFGAPFLALSIVGAGLLSGMRRIMLAVISTGIGVAVKLLLMFILMGKEELNIQGAAFSTVMCFFVAGSLNAVWAVSLCGINFSLISHIGKPLACALAMGIVTYLTYEYLLEQFLGVIAGGIIAIMLSAVLYGALCFVFQVFEPEEARFLPGAALFIVE